MQARTLLALALFSWTLALACPGQNAPSGRTDPGSASQEIDTLARDKPGDLPSFLRSKLSPATSIAAAGALVGRAFHEVGQGMTIPLARFLIFESVHTDQKAVLEIVRQALVNSPPRFHQQIVAAAIASLEDPELPVIIEIAAAGLGPEHSERADENATGAAGARANLGANDLSPDLSAQEGPLAYRVVAAGEPGALALGDAVLAAAASADPTLEPVLFPFVAFGHFLPEYNPPDPAAGGSSDLPPPVSSSSSILDPRLPLVSPSPSPVPVSVLASPTPRSTPTLSPTPTPTPTPTPRPTATPSPRATPRRPPTPTPTPIPTPTPVSP